MSEILTKYRKNKRKKPFLAGPKSACHAFVAFFLVAGSEDTGITNDFSSGQCCNKEIHARSQSKIKKNLV